MTKYRIRGTAVGFLAPLTMYIFALINVNADAGSVWQAVAVILAIPLFPFAVAINSIFGFQSLDGLYGVILGSAVSLVFYAMIGYSVGFVLDRRNE